MQGLGSVLHRSQEARLVTSMVFNAEVPFVAMMHLKGVGGSIGYPGINGKWPRDRNS